MNVIACNTNACVFEPIYSEDLKTVVDRSALPVIGWLVSESGHVNPLTCMGQPEGHYMVEFIHESGTVDYVHIPGMHESLSPWVMNKETNERTLEGVSKQRIIEKFQQLLEEV